MDTYITWKNGLDIKQLENPGLEINLIMRSHQAVMALICSVKCKFITCGTDVWLFGNHRALQSKRNSKLLKSNILRQ